MSFFRKLLGLCSHEWETVESGDLHRAYDIGTWAVGDAEPRKVCVGRWHTLRCKKCGELKNVVNKL